MSDNAIYERAAELVKVLRLSHGPGHDKVSVMLNREPTREEVEEAHMWHAAFRLVIRHHEVPPYALAKKLSGELN
jgi:hypothetical protein